MTKKELDELRDLLEEGRDERDEIQIDFKQYFRLLWDKRRYYCISLPLTLIVAFLLTMGIPKYYSVRVKLAPELSSMSSSGGGLNSVMRSLGLRSLSSSNSDGDAILPTLYPDLMNSQLFRVSLFDVPVVSADSSIHTTYYDYLDKYQKKPWWTRIIKGFFSSGKAPTHERQVPVNAAALTPAQARIASAISRNVVCGIDDRTFVITISVTAQDPMICATVADSTCNRLQQFITNYRMKKAKDEYDHVLEQYNVSKQEYEEATQQLAAFSNGNWDIVSDLLSIEKQSLQNQMQLKYSAFSAMSQQLLAARVKLNEASPVFTVLDGVTIPLRPAGPRRMGFVVGMLLLAFALQSAWILFRYRRRI